MTHSARIAERGGFFDDDVTGSTEWSTDSTEIAEYDPALRAFRLHRSGSTKVIATYTSGSEARNRSGSCRTEGTLTVRPPAATLQISPPSLMLAAGGTAQLQALRVHGNDSEDVTEAAVWSVEEGGRSRVTVSNLPESRGLVTALSAGATFVHTRLGDLEATAAVTVSERPFEGLEFRPNQVVVREAAETVVQVYAQEGGAWRPLSFPPCLPQAGSDGIFGVQIEEEGCRVRGISPGSGGIEVQAGGLTAMAQVTVQRFGIERVEVSPDSLSLAAGESFALTCLAVYTDGTDTDVTSDPRTSWRSSNLDVVRSVSGGMGRVESAGQVDVSCERDGLEASATLQVRPADPTSCRIDPPGSSLDVNETRQHALYCDYTDGTTQDRTDQGSWSSSDVSVATVGNQASDKGLVTAVAPGNTQIRATFQSFAATSTASVQTAPLQRIRCEPSSYTMGVSSQFQLSPILVFADGSESDAPAGSITYAVSGSAISVSSSGLVRGASPGSATITCTHRASNLNAQVNVTVIRSCATPQFDGAFSGGIGLWSVVNGQWEVGTPTHGPSQCYTPPYCAGTVLGGNSSCGQRSNLYSRRFTLCSLAPSESTIQLRWWEWFSFYGAYGRVYVQEWDSAQSQWGPYVVNGQTVATGSSPRWTMNSSVDLTAFSGRDIRLIFQHTNGAWNCRHTPGWFLDEVEVVAY